MNTNSIRYCLTCGREAYALGDFHIREMRLMGDGSPDFLVCEGPFAACPPPDLPEDWHLDLPVPSPEELAQMDLEAASLEMELEAALAWK